jgi:hypothetical protein
MKARQFWKTVVRDQTDLLDRFLTLIGERGIRYCVIGGQAVNAYAEPVVSLDLDLVVAADEVAGLEEAMAGEFTVRRFPHSINVSAAYSDLRIQIQTDVRYGVFLDRVRELEVLGMVLPVASAEDVLQGKIWAAQDPERRPSKRQKDLADIARLLEAQPVLRERVPEEILDRLV